MHIIIGLIMIIVGALVVIKSNKILNSLGRINFFERYLGAEGGSRLGYKLVGLLMIFIGILVVTNMIGGFIAWMFSPLLKFSTPPSEF